MIPTTTQAMTANVPTNINKKILIPFSDDGFGSSTWSESKNKHSASTTSLFDQLTDNYESYVAVYYTPCCRT